MSEPTGEPVPDAQEPYQEPAPYQEPTPEQLAERAARANKATRGALAGILGLEAVVTLLVPRAIAFTTGLGLTRTLILVGLAVLMIVAAGLVRRPFGIGVGTVLQLLFVLTGILLPAMFVVGAIFAAIWGYLLSLRHELVGTPGGWRLLVS
ncbi:MAG TPA: DUF4233 domain-containing protein [Jatrophihabitantaceae bacterium]|nr:DUF4233 domain-containing protein [Jatrophihabitantaceae bacterium]